MVRPLVCIFCKISCKKLHVNNPIFFDKKLRGNYTKSDKNFCRKMTKKGEKNNVKNSIFHDKKYRKIRLSTLALSQKSVTINVQESRGCNPLAFKGSEVTATL